MRNQLTIILLLLFIAAGTFPTKAHALVDFAAVVVATLMQLVNGNGLTFSHNTLQAIVILGITIVTIASVATAIENGRRILKRR